MCLLGGADAAGFLTGRGAFDAAQHAAWMPPRCSAWIASRAAAHLGSEGPTPRSSGKADGHRLLLQTFGDAMMRRLDNTTDELLGRAYFEARVRHDHPLRAIRPTVDEVIAGLLPPQPTAPSPRQRSVSPERVLRAMLLQALYALSSDRALMGWLEHDLLSRWFIGVNTDDMAWDHVAFSRQRNWLVDSGIADRFVTALLANPEVKAILTASSATGEIAPPGQGAWPRPHGPEQASPAKSVTF